MFHYWKCLYSTHGGHSQCLYFTAAHKINQALKKNIKTHQWLSALGWAAEYQQINKIHETANPLHSIRVQFYFILFYFRPLMPLSKLTQFQQVSFFEKCIQDTSIKVTHLHTGSITTGSTDQKTTWLSSAQGLSVLRCCYLLILIFYTYICT